MIIEFTRFQFLKFSAEVKVWIPLWRQITHLIKEKHLKWDFGLCKGKEQTLFCNDTSRKWAEKKRKENEQKLAKVKISN